MPTATRPLSVLISGASSGIGLCTALHLAADGHYVFAGYRSDSSRVDLESFAKARGLSTLFPVRLDVLSEASVLQAQAEIRQRLGELVQNRPLDALINNAGIARGGPIEATSLDVWREQFETNVFAVVRLTQIWMKDLRAARGRVVMISSVSGRVASPLLGPYAASKFALEAISDSLRREVMGLGMHVSVIEPGPIATPIWEKGQSESERQKSQLSDELRPVYQRMINRMDELIKEVSKTAVPPEEVARLIEHALISPKPRLRYPVGRGTKLQLWMARHFGEAVMDQLLAQRIKL